MAALGRCAVEIALVEFKGMSDRALAKMCGVSHPFVIELRKELVTDTSSPRLGLDGKVRAMPKTARSVFAGAASKSEKPGSSARDEKNKGQDRLWLTISRGRGC